MRTQPTYREGSKMKSLDLTADIIDVRDIIERYEELENQEDSLPDAEERTLLASILDNLKGCGCDEQWRGDWYPITLIADSYFVDYCIELVTDIGDLPKNIPNYLAIDWKATADNIQSDYNYIDIDDITYWSR